PDIGFLCPRFILFADEMLQAAKDDWGGGTPPFNYAVVGHDPDPTLDGTGNGAQSCCHCYQLVYIAPSNTLDVEGRVNGTANNPSAVPVPAPLIVQAFNTSAGGASN